MESLNEAAAEEAGARDEQYPDPTRADQPDSARGGCSVTRAGVSASEILPLAFSKLMAILVRLTWRLLR